MINVNGVTSTSQTEYSSSNNSTSGVNFDNILQTTTSSNSVLATGSSTLDDIFTTAANTYGIPVNLLKAVAKQESGFNANATSGVGAQGIMQLMPSTAASLGVTNPYDATQSIMGGAKYLKQQLDSFNGDTSLALAAYNAGPGNVRKYGGIPPFSETQKYVKNVLGYMGSEVTIPSNTNTLTITASSVADTSLSTASSTSTPIEDSSDSLNTISFATSQYLKVLEIQQDALDSLYSSDSDNEDDEASSLNDKVADLQAMYQSYNYNNSIIDLF